ncbi:hypothetical protein HD806DRAFT_8829 [Xylariaceae sp. AK1471]|nr:hypothetical protein HD806DRAFT_8829 [Xylariaceae sp. AK1471]
MSGPRRSRRWLIRLTQLLSIASTTSAVSLQDFQPITIIQIPSLSCLGAYGRTIRGCDSGDFKGGVQCSASCAKGVQEEEVTIMAACKNIDNVNSKSLLGLALRGGLLGALCPGLQATSVTSTVKSTTTRTFLTPSQTQETTTSTPTPIASTTESSSSIITSTSANTESLTTIQTTTSETNTLIVTTTPTDGASTATVPSTSTPSATQTNGGQNEQPGRGSSGGGSPFDTVFMAGSERLLQKSISVVAALTATLISAFLVG